MLVMPFMHHFVYLGSQTGHVHIIACERMPAFHDSHVKDAAKPVQCVIHI